MGRSLFHPGLCVAMKLCFGSILSNIISGMLGLTQSNRQTTLPFPFLQFHVAANISPFEILQIVQVNNGIHFLSHMV